MTTNYVLGFLFNLKQNHVLLIEKKRPDCQAGKLNGIGGHMETEELPYETMIREFKEETGIQYDLWREVCTMKGSDWSCAVYCGFSDLLWEAVATTDEQLIRVSVKGLSSGCLPNLHWLIPMCLDKEIVEGVYGVQNMTNAFKLEY